MNMIYFNGQFMAENTPILTADDRSFRFGDGIFETILIHHSRLVDAERHLKRLKRGLEFFHLDVDITPLPSLMAELIARNGIGTGYLRIIVSRGENPPGAIGYKPREPKPYFILQAMGKPFPAFSSISLHVSNIRSFYRLPCKVNSALHYAMSLMEAEAAGADNALLLSSEGYICETATGNLFWIKSDTLYTPDLTLPMVPGTVRETVLELWDGPVRQGAYALDELEGADEVFMTNVGGLVTAVREIQPMGWVFVGKKQTEVLREKLVRKVETEATL